MVKEEVNKKKGLSTGAWIAIGCGGCLVLVILLIIVIVVAAGKSVKTQTPVANTAVSTSTTQSKTDSYGYSQEAKTSFIDSCVSGDESNRAYCDCALSYLEPRYSSLQLAQMGSEYSKTKELSHGMKDAVDHCVQELKK